jgi:hypothetical protein
VYVGYGSLLAVFRVGKCSPKWGLIHFGQCSDMGNIDPREIWIVADSVQKWEISACEVRILAVSITWET